MKAITQFIIAFYELHPRKHKKIRHSLTLFRVISFYREFRWIQNCLSRYAYHQCIRELRFVLDSTIQAYYVDKRHYGSTMPCKLEIVKEIDKWGFGGRLVDKTDLKHKEDIKRLYGELSGYAHSTHKELVSSLPQDAKEIADLRFYEDAEMKEVCLKLAGQTIDAVFFVTLSLFPKILGPEMRSTNLRKSVLVFFQKHKCRLTLEKLHELHASDGILVKHAT